MEHEKLGYLYENGLGVEQSYEKTLERYQQAAVLWMPSGLISIGRMYENGLGVEQSVEKALEYYQQALDGGYYFTESELQHLDELKNKVD